MRKPLATETAFSCRRKDAGRSLDTGRAWEQLAREFLAQAGYTVLASNWRTRSGEIDIVCRQGESFVFVEVRYRKERALVDAASSVTPRKLRCLKKTAAEYLARLGVSLDTPWRVDLVLIDGDDIRLVRNVLA